MFNTSLVFAFLLTLIAGLSTGIGGIIVIFARKNGKWLPGFSMGFSAGVMTVVSFGDLLPESTHMLSAHLGMEWGGIISVSAFFVGLFCAAIIDKLVPETPNNDVGRVGIVSMIAMIIHNLPEGIATFMAGYQDAGLGISIAIAIALHNIPEGISVAIPIYYSTGKKSKAVMYALVSGLSEPLGAVLTAVILWRFIDEKMLGFLFGIIAGIMVYIAFNELIPLSAKMVEQLSVFVGVVLGVFVMLFVI